MSVDYYRRNHDGKHAQTMRTRKAKLHIGAKAIIYLWRSQLLNQFTTR